MIRSKCWISEKTTINFCERELRMERANADYGPFDVVHICFHRNSVRWRANARLQWHLEISWHMRDSWVKKSWKYADDEQKLVMSGVTPARRFAASQRISNEIRWAPNCRLWHCWNETVCQLVCENDILPIPKWLPFKLELWKTVNTNDHPKTEYSHRDVLSRIPGRLQQVAPVFEHAASLLFKFVPKLILIEFSLRCSARITLVRTGGQSLHGFPATVAIEVHHHIIGAYGFARR